MRDVIIGTAGHIDHGKTTLLKCLTGIDADRLQEEKRRGITIDIGFASMQLGDFRVGFIDVPGHEKFIKNMLAGIGGIDFVLLVVSAEESVMPQTIEHFQICRLLEIPRGIVAITKSKGVDEEILELVQAEVEDLMAGSLLESIPILAVDSVDGQGIEQLKTALLKELSELPSDSSRVDRIFRLPIDRVFTMKGFGTVITGTPTAGRLRKESTVVAYPTMLEGKVRGIEVFNHKVDEALAGQRAALNIAGLEKTRLERGMTLAPPGALNASSMFDAELRLLPDAPAPLKQRSPVRLHHGSAELIGRVYLLDRDQLAAGDTGLVQIRLDKPTVACPLDHFIVRRYSPLRTIGGGIVLDNSPAKHRRKDLPGLLPALQALQSELKRDESRRLRALVDYFVKSRVAQGLGLGQLAARTGFLETDLLQLLKGMDDIVVVPQDPPLAVFQPALEELEQGLVNFVSNYCSKNPLLSGVSQEEVKKRFMPDSAGAYFQFVLDRLQQARRLQAASGTIAPYGTTVELTDEQKRISVQVTDLFETRKFQPPTLDEILDSLQGFPSAQVKEIFYYLLQKGELVRLSGDIVLLRAHAEWLESRLREAHPPGETFDVAQFKDLFGITRKFAIPFLEFLDRRRVTRRVADKRVVL